MTIKDARSARGFVAAWAGHGSRAAWVYRFAAESQRACAILAQPNKLEAERHRGAARVLEDAASRIDAELQAAAA